jgi:two-component system, repressor protein LuxO
MVETQIAATFPGLKVLVVEDLLALAIQYKSIAGRLDVDVTIAGRVTQAKRCIAEGPWHAALIDLNLPDGSGFEVMQALLAAYPACSVVVITAEDSLDVAVRASQAGAFDFIQKPVEAERLLVTLRNALNASHLNQRVASLQTVVPKQFEQFIGQSPEMQTVYKMIETVASSNASVCITGESGTGKELAAAAIHARSPRKVKKLVAINCAAIPKELIESELFGHARGAFTGAVTDRQGVFIEADKGTLFLDEIAELDLGVQAKLLRVLQTGEVKRLGEDKTRIVDVRIVCATHRNLAERVRAGEFREDLFYRLFVVPIDLPPLRNRGGDIALIARNILARYAREDGKRFTDFSPEALAALGNYAWPGNVRELLNVIRAVVALNDAERVEWQMLPASLKTSLVEEKPWFSLPDGPAVASANPVNQDDQANQVNPATAASPVQAVSKNMKPGTKVKATFDAKNIRPLPVVERELIDYALRTFGGNVAKAARALQVNPSTLYRKIQGWTDDGVDIMTPLAEPS